MLSETSSWIELPRLRWANKRQSRSVQTNTKKAISFLLAISHTFQFKWTPTFASKYHRYDPVTLTWSWGNSYKLLIQLPHESCRAYRIHCLIFHIFIFMSSNARRTLAEFAFLSLSSIRHSNGNSIFDDAFVDLGFVKMKLEKSWKFTFKELRRDLFSQRLFDWMKTTPMTSQDLEVFAVPFECSLLREMENLRQLTTSFRVIWLEWLLRCHHRHLPLSEMRRVLWGWRAGWSLGIKGQFCDESEIN